MPTMPALFVSHGAPSLALEGGTDAEALAAVALALPRPTAILCASAHWETAAPRVSSSAHPETIHDFGGFGPELEAMTYPAPGSPALAARAVALLRDAGIADAATVDRGLDHGAWVPLSLMWPDADIPVVQLSLQPRLGPQHHLALGRALAPLRAEGVLVLGSGGATHNLRELGAGAALPAWAAAFDAWLAERVERGEVERLLAWRTDAPHAARNHPTDEHLLPLFVALGAGGGSGRRVHSGAAWGSLSMAAFAFA